MEIKYVQKGDYLIPDFKIKNNKKIELNKFGKLRLDYIKKYKKGFYTTLLMKEELPDYLENFQEETMKLYNETIEKEKIKLGINEKLKENNQMEWVQSMNYINNMVLEIINAKLIYV